MKTVSLAALAITAALLAPAAEAAPQDAAPVPAGSLTCQVDPGLGFVIGSSRRVDCTFEHLDRQGRTVGESYIGLMRRAGFDIGVSGPQTVTWLVSTADGRIRAGMLEGAFNGASAEATFLVGPGMRALFGETGDRVVLEPVPEAAQFGLNLAAGSAGLQLVQVPTATYSSLK